MYLVNSIQALPAFGGNAFTSTKRIETKRSTDNPFLPFQSLNTPQVSNFFTSSYDTITFTGEPQLKKGDKLTERELEVLRLAAEGESNQAIGRQLDISDNTVGSHLRHIFIKLGVNCRIEMARIAREKGLLPKPEQTTTESPLKLSPRELDVARLLLLGLTNDQIGRRLYIKRRTVEHHINNIFNKLGVRNRTQAVTALLDNGIVSLPDEKET